MKLLTEIQVPPSRVSVGLDDAVMLLGSCFTTEVGARMSEAGFDCMVNPFGTLYNPASIASAVARLDADTYFCAADCVEMGAGAGLMCSFEHHTSFARASEAEFLENANAALERSREFWRRTGKVIITLGTALVWRREGRVVSNCLKRPGTEFSREMLSVSEAAELLRGIVLPHPEKEFIFTVSPIRHMGEGGAHLNTLSKATLQLAVQACLDSRSGLDCFPAYEIMMDELRDYRFYAADMLHPSPVAIDHIWEKFRTFCVPSSQMGRVAYNVKSSRQSAHRKILK